MRLLAFFYTLCCLANSSTCYSATVLVTGANRGIGYELVKQYAARGWGVIATTRDPENSSDLKSIAATNKSVSIEQLDVSDTTSIKTLAAKYRTASIDVLINNAGVLGLQSAQKLGSLDYAEFQGAMVVNAFGPLALADAFQEQVARSELKKIISISSGNATISGNSVPGGLYFYRSSKAALNIMMRGLSSDLADQGIIVAVISPGSVDTDMGRQARGSRQEGALSASQSVSGIIKVIDGLTAKNNNLFYRYDGTVQPW